MLGFLSDAGRSIPALELTLSALTKTPEEFPSESQPEFSQGILNSSFLFI